jgi:hypothetical protein
MSMKAFIKTIFVGAILAFFITQNGYSQYASKAVRPVYKAYTDSIKNMDYNRVFPFWGSKAYKRGIDIPYPIGFMANYFWMNQGILIDNFQLGIDKIPGDGFEDVPLTNLPDSILSFKDNRNVSWSFNVRPDIWVFPFIDLYGIFGYGRSTTTVKPYLPFLEDGNIPADPVEQGITTYGVGALFAGGVGPVWLSLDANVTWNKPELLDKATMANVIGIRMGKLFKFNRRPQSNVSLWIGTMFVTMQSETKGAIKLGEVIPDIDWDRLGEIGNNYMNWFNGLPAPVQDRISETGFHKIFSSISDFNKETTIMYGMDKQVKQHWNGLIGAQYQLNKTWQLRAEGGVIGDRKSFLLSLNYRLLGFKKKAKVL